MMSLIQKNIINIYTGIPLEGMKVIFILENYFNKERGIKKNLWNFFDENREEQTYDFIRIVPNPEDADFLCMPHNYFVLKKLLGEKLESYISQFVSTAKKFNKKILIFAMADSDEDIDIPNAIIFRFSQYGYKKKENEIMIPFYASPAYSADGMSYREEVWKSISFRNKGKKPTVSFCGWAGFPSIYRHMTYTGRVFSADIKKYFFGKKYAELHKSGIYFRRKALGILKKSKNIETNFIIRGSYSAQKGLDGKKKINPEDAEKEYIDSIIQSDFVLAPKGHGNGSIRFYEALSLGRFPILINTDCVLPLAKRIDYDKIVVSVDYKDMHNIEKYVTEFYDKLTDEEFHERQLMAREAFELLRPPSLLKIVLSEAYTFSQFEK